MKKSKKYLHTLILFFHIAVFTSVGISSRLDLPMEGKPKVDELFGNASALVGFDKIYARGNFNLEVLEDSDYSIEYSAENSKGDFTAMMIESQLYLEKFTSLSLDKVVSVRLKTPQLKQLRADSLVRLNVEGFEEEMLYIQLTRVNVTSLRNSQWGELSVQAEESGKVSLLGVSTNVLNMEIDGETVIAILE